MPEGDTIHHSARQLRKLLPGALIQDVSIRRHGRVDQHTAMKSLNGLSFSRVEAKGKHLLMHLEDGQVLHSHMGMTGSWHIYTRHEPWNKAPQSAALTLQVQRAELPGDYKVVCFSPRTLELLTATQFRRHPYLRRLGPDLMLPEFDANTILARFRVHGLTPIGEAVMNQTIVCGIGNVYKSECLFLSKISPFRLTSQLTDEQVLLVAKTAQDLMHQNTQGHPRQTRRSGDGERMWVYGRRGKACFRCGNSIQMSRQGDLGRSTYWCPGCQEQQSAPNPARSANDGSTR